MLKSLVKASVVLTLVGFVFFLSVPRAHAAEFNIPCGADNAANVAALISAINDANSNGVADTINLAAGCTYTLTAVDNDTDGPNGLPSITSEITISGNAATIERDTSSPNFRIIHSSGNLVLNNTTIANGYVDTGETYGGGILNTNQMVINDSIITDNTASTGGGGIGNLGGIATINRSLIINNNGTLLLCSGCGGNGIINIGKFNLGSELTVNNSMIANNLSFYANYGGIRNTVYSSLTVNNSTIVGNQGTIVGGIQNNPNSTLTITNSIVSQNISGANQELGGPINSGGYNLFGNTNGTILSGDTTTNLIGVDPMLGPLQDNGGPTHTMSLLPGSPALDAGNCTSGMDQRGVSRPYDLPGVANVGNGCDIGAVESQNLGPVVINDSYQTTQNVPLTIPAPGVLGNDTDPNQASLTANLLTNVSNGILQFGVNGGFVYTPNSGFKGVDTFTYSAYSNPNYPSNGTVTITVNNAPPVATVDSYITPINTSLTIAAPGILGNDSDATNEPLTAHVVTEPVNGVLTLNSNGAFSYSPANDFHGTDSFTYVANDGTDTSSPTSVIINVQMPGESAFPPTGLTITGNLIKPTYSWTHAASPGSVAVPDLYYNVVVIGDDVLVDEWFFALEICNGTSCSAMPDVELIDGNYSWYVQSASSTIISTRSQDATFTVDTDGVPAPNIIQKIIPAADAEIPSGSVRFEWQPDPNASYYRLRITSVSGFHFEEWFEGPQICTTMLCFTNRDLPSGSYEWSVVGWGPGGMGASGNPTTANSLFYVGVRPPSAITPIYPANASSLTGTQGVQMQWQSVDNALWYRVVVSGSDGYLSDEWYEGAVVCNNGICTADEPHWLSNGAYIWYVAGWNDDGLGAWNSGWTFVVNSVAPGVIQRIAPTGTVTTLEVPFQWQADLNASWYRLYALADNGYFYDQWINGDDVCSNGICTYTDAIIPNGDYQWWMVGWGPGGMGDWDLNALSFSLNIAPPDKST